MLSDEHIGEVRCLIPTGLARHLVVNLLTVDLQILKTDVVDAAVLIVAGQDGHPCMTAIV